MSPVMVEKNLMSWASDLGRMRDRVWTVLHSGSRGISNQLMRLS